MIKQMMLLVLVVMCLGTGCASTGGVGSMYANDRSVEPAWIHMHSAGVYHTDDGEQGVRVIMSEASTDDDAVRLCVINAHDHMCLAAGKVKECAQGQRFKIKLVSVSVHEDLWAHDTKRMHCKVALDSSI